MLDKTGTVTEGRMELAGVTPLDGASRTEILRLAGAVEAASEHPIAQAVAAAARREVGELPVGHLVQERPGCRRPASVEGHEVEVGRRDGTITVSRDGVLLRATLSVRDTVKPTSAEAIAELGRLGLTLVLHRRQPRDRRALPHEVGIEHVLAEVYPEDKVAEVRRLQEAGRWLRWSVTESTTPGTCAG